MTEPHPSQPLEVREALRPARPRGEDVLGGLATGDATARVAARGYNACEREGLLMLGGYDALDVPHDWCQLYG